MPLKRALTDVRPVDLKVTFTRPEALVRSLATVFHVLPIFFWKTTLPPDSTELNVPPVETITLALPTIFAPLRSAVSLVRVLASRTTWKVPSVCWVPTTSAPPLTR